MTFNIIELIGFCLISFSLGGAFAMIFILSKLPDKESYRN